MHPALYVWPSALAFSAAQPGNVATKSGPAPRGAGQCCNNQPALCQGHSTICRLSSSRAFSCVRNEHYCVLLESHAQAASTLGTEPRGKVGSQLLDSFQQPCSFRALPPPHRPLQLICAHTATYPESIHPVSLQPEFFQVPRA